MCTACVKLVNWHDCIIDHTCGVAVAVTAAAWPTGTAISFGPDGVWTCWMVWGPEGVIIFTWGWAPPAAAVAAAAPPMARPCWATTGGCCCKNRVPPADVDCWCCNTPIKVAYTYFFSHIFFTNNYWPAALSWVSLIPTKETMVKMWWISMKTWVALASQSKGVRQERVVMIAEKPVFFIGSL